MEHPKRPPTYTRFIICQILVANILPPEYKDAFHNKTQTEKNILKLSLEAVLQGHYKT
jgi:hypothetical protein